MYSSNVPINDSITIQNSSATWNMYRDFRPVQIVQPGLSVPKYPDYGGLPSQPDDKHPELFFSPFFVGTFYKFKQRHMTVT